MHIIRVKKKYFLSDGFYKLYDVFETSWYFEELEHLHLRDDAPGPHFELKTLKRGPSAMSSSPTSPSWTMWFGVHWLSFRLKFNG